MSDETENSEYVVYISKASPTLRLHIGNERFVAKNGQFFIPKEYSDLLEDMRKKNPAAYASVQRLDVAGALQTALKHKAAQEENVAVNGVQTTVSNLKAMANMENNMGVIPGLGEDIEKASGAGGIKLGKK